MMLDTGIKMCKNIDITKIIHFPDDKDLITDIDAQYYQIKFLVGKQFKTLVEIALEYEISLKQLYQEVLKLEVKNNKYVDLKPMILNTNFKHMPRKYKDNVFGIDFRFYIFKHTSHTRSYCSCCKAIEFQYFDEDLCVQKCTAVDAALMGLINGKTVISFNDKKTSKDFKANLVNEYENITIKKIIDRSNLENAMVIKNINLCNRFISLFSNEDFENMIKTFKIHRELEKRIYDLNLCEDHDLIHKSVTKSLSILKQGNKISKLYKNINNYFKLEKEKILEKDYLLSIRDEILNMNMYRFIGSTRIDIYRETDNSNNKTFDFVKVTIVTPLYFNRTKDFLKKYRKEFTNIILEKIKINKSFQKFNIPINFLKLTNITIKINNEIVVIFELKSI